MWWKCCAVYFLNSAESSSPIGKYIQLAAAEDEPFHQAERRCRTCSNHAEAGKCLPKEIAEDNERIMRGREPQPSRRKVDFDGLKKFEAWADKNGDRIRNAKALPYFVKDNQALINSLSKTDGGNISELSAALGIRRGEPMTFDEANEMRGNPHYAEDKIYQINCQSAVVANELRRRGWDVEAFGSIKNSVPKMLAYRTEAAWIDADGNIPKPIRIMREVKSKTIDRRGSVRRTFESDREFLAKVYDATKEPGRYHISWKWASDKHGHIVTCERLSDGKIRWYDPQTGKLGAPSLSRIDTKLGLKVLRVDSLQPNVDVVRGVVRKAGAVGYAPIMDDVLKEFWRKILGGNTTTFGSYANITERLGAMHSANAKDLVRLQREIVADKMFKPVEGMKNVWSAVSDTDSDYERLIAGAKRAVMHGYEVYLLPNPHGIRTPDYIFKKKGFIGSYDLKTIMGENSVSTRLMESIGQTNRVILNMATQYNPRTLAKDIRGYFEANKDAVQVKVFKGGKEITINRKFAMDKNFILSFIKEYSKK